MNLRRPPPRGLQQSKKFFLLTSLVLALLFEWTKASSTKEITRQRSQPSLFASPNGWKVIAFVRGGGGGGDSDNNEETTTSEEEDEPLPEVLYVESSSDEADEDIIMEDSNARIVNARMMDNVYELREESAEEGVQLEEDEDDDSLNEEDFPLPAETEDGEIEMAADEKNGKEENTISPGDLEEDFPSLVGADSSSNNVDRLDWADAYDDDEGGETTQHSQDDIPVVNAAPNTPISPELKEILIQHLQYRPKEVARMRYDIAVLLVHKKIIRPPEGVPPHWLLQQEEGAISTQKPTFVRRIVLPILTTAVLAVAGIALSSDQRTSTTPAFSDSNYTEDLFHHVLTGTEALQETDEIKSVNEHVNRLEDIHPHSVKPDKRRLEHPKDAELDVTFLDKSLTRIETAIQHMFKRQ